MANPFAPQNTKLAPLPFGGQRSGSVGDEAAKIMVAARKRPVTTADASQGLTFSGHGLGGTLFANSTAGGKTKTLGVQSRKSSVPKPRKPVAPLQPWEDKKIKVALEAMGLKRTAEFLDKAGVVGFALAGLLGMTRMSVDDVYDLGFTADIIEVKKVRTERSTKTRALCPLCSPSSAMLTLGAAPFVLDTPQLWKRYKMLVEVECKHSPHCPAGKVANPELTAALDGALGPQCPPDASDLDTLDDAKAEVASLRKLLQQCSDERSSDGAGRKGSSTSVGGGWPEGSGSSHAPLAGGAAGGRGKAPSDYAANVAAAERLVRVCPLSHQSPAGGLAAQTENRRDLVVVYDRTDAAARAAGEALVAALRDAELNRTGAFLNDGFGRDWGEESEHAKAALYGAEGGRNGRNGRMRARHGQIRGPGILANRGEAFGPDI